MKAVYCTPIQNGPVRCRVLYFTAKNRVMIQVTGKSRAGYFHGEMLDVDAEDVFDDHRFRRYGSTFRGRMWRESVPPYQPAG